MGSTDSLPNPTLFSPLQLGPVRLEHRIALAPLTRMRGTSSRVPTALMKEYYTQRASTPGTLLITEGTYVSLSAAGGFPHAPGLWNEEQVDAWREITDAVHAEGSFIFVQLFAAGRAADLETAEGEGIEVVAPSAIPLKDRPEGDMPREMTRDEIQQVVKDFGIAARNAMRAGFDGVEAHVANGYLLDQFVQDVSNQRTDEYGGGYENRSRIVLEVLQEMIDAVGGERSRVGIRISPWGDFQDMRMDNPVPQFRDLLERVTERWANLAYLHVVESRISGAVEADGSAYLEQKVDWAYDIWPKTSAILVAGGLTLESARKLVEEEYPDRKIVVVFGRLFLANPDLVYRFRHGLKLNLPDRNTFYTAASPMGYIDYPFSEQYLTLAEAKAKA